MWILSALPEIDFSLAQEAMLIQAEGALYSVAKLRYIPLDPARDWRNGYLEMGCGRFFTSSYVVRKLIVK
jgi:hypothetical protein